jgi:Domain of unknown function (DUF4276)
MILHFPVEGLSEEAFLNGFLPRLIPKHQFRIYPHEGKGKLSRVSSSRALPANMLLDTLPLKIRSWGRTLNPHIERVIVLVDADNEQCTKLLSRVNECIQSIQPRPPTSVRIAIEELESWYLGDAAAVLRAFPRADRQKLKTYVPESICASWEYFADTIGFPGSDQKVLWAEKMGKTISIPGHSKSANRCESFVRFCKSVKTDAGEL